MQTPPSSIPDLEGLTLRLNAILANSGAGGGPVEAVQRRRPRLMSTFPIEIVTCRLADGTLRRLFLKYQSDKSNAAHGHRGGVPYEAEVYRRILASRQGSRPRFYGTYVDRKTGETWLALEHLDRGTQIKEIRIRKKGIAQQVAMVFASRWIARFHADLATPTIQGSFGFLNRYDAEYYAGWARRTYEFTSAIHATCPWLPRLCERAGELLAPLLTGPLTVIHGEFYTNNILLCRQNIHAVDWESTALGCGAIDLAALTEGSWSPRLVRSCEREYVRTRWPQEAPPEFERTLEAARLYLHFRWLGDRSDRTLSEMSSWRIERLRSTAAKLGLVERGAPGSEPPPSV